MGIFSQTGRFYTNIPQLGRNQIPAPVFILIGICSAVFLTTCILDHFNPALKQAILDQVLMSTDVHTFSNKPWTVFTSMFFHQSGLLYLSNMVGILLFGNLASVLFSKKVVIPLFIAGGLMSSVSIWIFKSLPLTETMLVNQWIGGASGGMMTLAIIATFYMPEHIFRLYGVYPLKLKFIGRGMLLFSIASIFFKYDIIPNFLHLGGALGGYVFLVLLKRHRFSNTPSTIFSTRKKVHESAQVEVTGILKKPITDEQYNGIQVSKKEYLDHLLDKISRNGIDSLSFTEIEFLNRYSQE